MFKDNMIVLKTENITKQFPGVLALDNVSFSLRKGTVHAIVGQNGAGKTTLMNILTGAIIKDSGKIFINDKKVTINSTIDAIKLGLAKIHQEMFIVPDMTVAENIFLGDMPAKGFLGPVDFKAMYLRSDKIFKDIGVDIDVKRKVRGLGVGEQQLIMIARALHSQSNIIIMDEPTSSLNLQEVENLFKIIRKLVNAGRSIIYISHYLSEIFKIAEEVTVLRNGKKIITEKLSNISEDQVIEKMLGYKEESKKFILNKKFGQVAIEVKNINRHKILNNVSFNVREGEVVGLAGHLGAGRTELVRAIFGADKKDSGTVLISGKPVEIKSPSGAIKNGLGLLTEEKIQGIIPLFSVMNNISLSNLREISRSFHLNFSKEQEIANNYIELLNIKVSSIMQRIINLSGGNQQKVIFAKWLHSKTKILFLDEPTKGIDVGAKIEILNMIINLAKERVAIILISSEFSDLVNICNRILIMRKGKIVKELTDFPSDSFLQSAVNG